MIPGFDFERMKFETICKISKSIIKLFRINLATILQGRVNLARILQDNVLIIQIYCRVLARFTRPCKILAIFIQDNSIDLENSQKLSNCMHSKSNPGILFSFK